jgi:DNA-binding NtrC family response regulator
MKTRCLNPNARNYKRYGARGISVCASWLIFSNFLKDMGKRPSSVHSLERKDNDGQYSPNNCLWATAEQQAKNRRSNHRITFGSKTLNLEEWADLLGINRQTLSTRLNQMGWPVEKALTAPVRRLAPTV